MFVYSFLLLFAYLLITSIETIWWDGVIWVTMWIIAYLIVAVFALWILFRQT